MNLRRDPAQALPLSTPAFYILVSLADGERHGYSINREVEESTNGCVRLGATTLYRYLRQMHADGWIEEVDGSGADDPRRRSYRITSWGKRVAQAEAMRLADVLRVAKSRMLLPASISI